MYQFNRSVQIFLVFTICGFNLALLDTVPPCSAKRQKQVDGYALSSMEAFSWVLLQLPEDYVDPSRIQPGSMLKATLEYIERRAPEVEIKLKSGNATVQIGSKQKTFQVGYPDTIWEMNTNLAPIFRFIDENLEANSDPKDLEFAAINGMLSTLDPHSNLLPPELFREMRLKTTGEFGGLGIRITIRDGGLTIISPMPNTPAARMELKTNDKIVRISDQSTENMPLDEAVTLLRGKKGTKVTIWVMRKGWSEPHKYVVTRDIIRVRSVISKLLDNKIGYIQIQDFGRHTAGDLLRHLTNLKREAKGLDGLVLDLRNNAGGLMKAAVQVADLFLDRGIIVATVTYDNDYISGQKTQKSREVQRAREDGVEHDLPIVVLINNGSASASEILSGALKNLDRAVLMGQQTFGKGTVQILNERVPESVKGACLKLTVAEYLIPGDISIQEIGVTPDIQLTPVLLEKDQIQIFAEREYRREEDIKSHLKTQKPFNLKPTENIRYVYEEDDNGDETKSNDNNQKEKQDDLDEPEFVEDFETRLAKEFLLKAPDSKGSAMLDKGLAFLRQVQKEQQQKIETKMKQLGIDWSIGNGLGARGEVVFQLLDEKGIKQPHAPADQEVRLSLKISNVGNAPFFQLRAETKCKNPLYDKQEFLFGRIDPDTTKSWEIPVKIPKAVINRSEDLRFVFSCEGGQAPSPVETTISTKELPRPTFGFSWRVLDSKGNGDGLIQPGEPIELEVTVSNLGEGKAYQVKGLLQNEAGKDVYLKTGKGRVSYKEILPGKSATRSFAFQVQDHITTKRLPFELSIWDADLGIVQVAELDLPVYTKLPRKSIAVPTNLLVKKHRAAIHGGADGSSPIVALAKQGSKLASDLRLGPWYRVLSNNKQPAGWIHTKYVKKTSSQITYSSKSASWEPFTQVTPPKITLQPLPAYLATGSSLRLIGTIEDSDQPLRDTAVWVNSEKVFLKAGASLKNPHLIELDVPIQLNPGPNVISIIAREGHSFSSTKTKVVTIPGGLDWEEEDRTVADRTQTNQDME